MWVLFAAAAAVIASRSAESANTAFYLALLLTLLLSLASLHDGLSRGLERPGFAIAVDGLVLNWLLIRRYGSSGAAIATGTSLAVQHLLMLLFVVRRLHVDPTALSTGWRWIRARSS